MKTKKQREHKLEKSLERHSKNSYLKNAREELSIKWLNQRKMNAQKRVSARKNLLSQADVSTDEKYTEGFMYFFRYDAKTKMKLKYYDEYPLVLFFNSSGKNGLRYGINVHYLPVKIRAVILDYFLDSRKDGNWEITPARLVESLWKHPAFKPAIHSYYPSHIVGNLTEIPASEWEDVLFLPVAKFVSYTKNPHSTQQVYADYYRKI